MSSFSACDALKRKRKKNNTTARYPLPEPLPLKNKDAMTQNEPLAENL